MFTLRKRKEAQSGLLSIGEVAPRTRTQITVPYQFSKLKADSEYFVKIQFLLKDNMPWADKNFAQAEEQIFVKEATARPSIATVNSGSNKPPLASKQAA